MPLAFNCIYKTSKNDPSVEKPAFEKLHTSDSLVEINYNENIQSPSGATLLIIYYFYLLLNDFIQAT